MLSLRFGASPHYNAYLKALMSVKKSENPEMRFRDMHRIFDAMLAEPERRVNDILSFLNFLPPFFERRTLRDSELGTSWTALTDAYRFRYDNQTPSIVFETTDLLASRRDDSLFIFKTSGVLFPLENKWKGKGGKVTWERRGLGKDVHVLLDDYEMEVNKGVYEVEKVKFFYPQFFGNQAIEGKFSDKLIAGDDATVGSYPRFESAQPVTQLGNLGKGLSYAGGFRMYGATVYGFATTPPSCYYRTTTTSCSTAARPNFSSSNAKNKSSASACSRRYIWARTPFFTPRSMCATTSRNDNSSSLAETGAATETPSSARTTT